MAARKRKTGLQNGSIDHTVGKRSKQAYAPGVIKKIVLHNFMCHSLLEVSFVENINFLIGRNGSGKSAILTSLLMGFGGKASLTSRGTSVKNFIKSGHKSATIEITVRNEGSLTYKNDVYGNEITISRHFTASGASSYKIKSENGNVISTHAREIQNICTFLNIQVDNPVCILNQDTSRNFLNSKDAKQKFILFMRATKLDSLKEDYTSLAKNHKICCQLLEDKEKAFHDLHNEVLALKERCENQRTLIKMKEELNELQVKLLWAQVRDLEKELEEKQQVERQIEQEYSKVKSSFQNVNESLQNIDQAIRSVQEQASELQDKISSQIAIKQEILLSRNPLADSIVKKKRQAEMLHNDIVKKKKNRENLEREISVMSKTFEKIEQEELERLNELKKLEENLKSIDEILQTSNNDDFQMRNSVNRLEEEIKSLRSEIRQMTAKIENTQSKLNNLQKETGNNLSLYGRNMVRLVNAIHQHKNDFKHLPRGPLGSYIALRDKEWSVAVESYLGTSMLRAFTVDNQADGELLMKIINGFWTEGGKPMVITSKFFFQVHDVSRNLVKAPSQCVSLYDALEISDPVVSNCLIDQCSVENILLIPNNDLAFRLLSNARNVPVNCKQGIICTGDQYFPDPNFKFYGCRYRKAQLLQVSTEEIIEDLQQTLQSMKANKETAQQQYDSVCADFRDQQEKIKQLDIKITKLNRAKTHLKCKFDNLNNNGENEAMNIQAFEKEVTQLKAAIEQRETVAKKIQDEVKELEARTIEKEEELKEINKIIDSHDEQIVPIRRRVKELQLQRHEITINENYAKQRTEQYKSEMDNAKHDTLLQKKRVDVEMKNAKKVGQRIDDPRSVPEIVQRVRTVQGSIRRIESDSTNLEELLKELENKNLRYRKSERILEEIKTNAIKLKQTADRRLHFYTHTEKYFITFVKHAFKSAMEARNFDARIDIDVPQKRLDIMVKPQQGIQDYTSTSNLSGGERSFSTVCFLYSLWQCLKFPFCFLDEFDVFMDKANRTRVMEILIEHAKKNSTLQFVFLTPQDVSFIDDERVAIHRLEDPRKN